MKQPRRTLYQHYQLRDQLLSFFISWMKSCGVTIQMKPLQQYFYMALFTQYVALTFKSVDERLWCDLRPLIWKLFRSFSSTFRHGSFFFETMAENLCCVHTNKNNWAVHWYRNLCLSVFYNSTGKLDFCWINLLDEKKWGIYLNLKLELQLRLWHLQG